MYEALRAIKEACADLGITRHGIEAMFHDNADRLIASVLAAKASPTEAEG